MIILYPGIEVKEMKLLMIVMNDEDREDLTQTLSKHGISVTLISSTGEFLNYGDTTLLMGVKDSECDRSIRIMKEFMKERYPQRNEQLNCGHVFLLNVDHYDIKPASVTMKQDKEKTIPIENAS